MIHFIAQIMGLTNASGPWYLFWSGIVGDAFIISAGIAIYRKHNCHEPRCWRIGKHPVNGTPFTACAKHHPEMYGKPAKGHMTQAFHRARIDNAKRIKSGN